MARLLSLDTEARHILRTLHRSKKLALVSNFDHPPHVHSVLSRLGLMPFFHLVVISGEVGVKKPDPRIFDLALEQTRMEPKDVILSVTRKTIQKPPVLLVLFQYGYKEIMKAMHLTSEPINTVWRKKNSRLM